MDDIHVVQEVQCLCEASDEAQRLVSIPLRTEQVQQVFTVQQFLEPAHCRWRARITDRRQAAADCHDSSARR